MTALVVALVVGGLILLMLAFTLPSKEKLSLERNSPMPIEERPNLPVPVEWDETALTHRIESYSDNPDLLTRFIDGVRDRLITGQNIKTIQKRTEFLRVHLEHRRVQLEHLKTEKDVKSQMYDLRFLETEQQIRR